LQEQAFTILRNLAYPASEIDFLLQGLGRDDLVDLTEIGMSSNAAETLSQASHSCVWNIGLLISG
jgi:hypothetical protein